MFSILFWEASATKEEILSIQIPAPMGKEWNVQEKRTICRNKSGGNPIAE